MADDRRKTDDRRKSERYHTPGLKSNISDGKSAFFVVVEDVSTSGVGVSKIPKNFDETVQKCMATVNAPLDDFKLHLSPRWVDLAEDGKYKRIGFHIENPPTEWLEFVEGMKSGKAKRTSGRHKTLALMSTVSDGNSTFIGIVEEISKDGLRLTQIPTDFDDTTGECTAVVQSPTGDLNISMHPCWVKSTNKGMYKTIGFQIENPTAGWKDFIRELEKESGDLSFFLLGADLGDEE